MVEVVRTAGGAETGRWLGSRGRLQRVDAPILDAYDPVFSVDEDLDGQWRLSSVEELLDGSGARLGLTVCSPKPTPFFEPGRIDVEYQIWSLDPDERFHAQLLPERRRLDHGVVGYLQAGGTALASMVLAGVLLTTCLGRDAPHLAPAVRAAQPDRMVRIDLATYEEFAKMQHLRKEHRKGGKRLRARAAAGLSGIPEAAGNPEPPFRLPTVTIAQNSHMVPDPLAWTQMCRGACGDGPVPPEDVVRRDLDSRHCTCEKEDPS